MMENELIEVTELWIGIKLFRSISSFCVLFCVVHTLVGFFNLSIQRRNYNSKKSGHIVKRSNNCWFGNNTCEASASVSSHDVTYVVEQPLLM